MRRPLAICMVALAAACLSACVGDGPEVDSTSTSASETTKTPRITDTSGRPPVTFDPCFDIPDPVIEEAGFDPQTKELSDAPGGDSYSFLGCKIKTPVRQYRLALLSGNVTFEEERTKTASFARPIEINGRQGLLKLNPDLNDACAVSLETNYGILILARDYLHGGVGKAPQEEWCAGLEDTARLIEPLLPKD